MMDKIENRHPVNPVNPVRFKTILFNKFAGFQEAFQSRRRASRADRSYGMLWVGRALRFWAISGHGAQSSCYDNFTGDHLSWFLERTGRQKLKSKSPLPKRAPFSGAAGRSLTVAVLIGGAALRTVT